MDPAIMQVITVAISQTIMVPLLVFVLQKVLGKRLDSFDEKRDQARKEQKARETYRSAWEDSITQGVRSLLRSEIISEYRKATSEGYATLETKEYVEKLHSAYSAVGGNSIGTSMFEAIIAMPTKPPATQDNEEQQED